MPGNRIDDIDLGVTEVHAPLNLVAVQKHS
jgi:hypothetical protein